MQQINLLTPEMLPRQDWLTGRTVVIASAVTLGVTLLMAGWVRWQIARLEPAYKVSVAHRGALDEQLRAAEQHANTAPDHALEQQISQLETTLNTRQAALDYLRGDQAGAAGFSRYMEAFAQQRVSGLWLTGFSVDDKSGDILIGGRTRNPELVPRYISVLGRAEVLRGRAFSALQVTRPERVAKPVEPTAPNDAHAAPPPEYLEFKLQSLAKEAKESTASGVVRPPVPPPNEAPNAAAISAEARAARMRAPHE